MLEGLKPHFYYGYAVINIYICVHRHSITGKDPRVSWDLQRGELLLEVFGVLYVGGNEFFKALEMEVDPSTQVCEQGTTATDDWANFPRCLMDPN